MHFSDIVASQRKVDRALYKWPNNINNLKFHPLRSPLVTKIIIYSCLWRYINKWYRMSICISFILSDLENCKGEKRIRYRGYPSYLHGILCKFLSRAIQGRSHYLFGSYLRVVLIIFLGLSRDGPYDFLRAIQRWSLKLFKGYQRVAFRTFQGLSKSDIYSFSRTIQRWSPSFSRSILKRSLYLFKRCSGCSA